LGLYANQRFSGGSSVIDRRFCTRLAPDLATALAAEPQAQQFFNSLATFYRNTYVKWIEGAKRPETRAKRIAEMIDLLKAGKKQKGE